MGEESVQIRKHIDEERKRLDINIAKLESDFELARAFVTNWWKRPLMLVGIAIGILVVIGNGVLPPRQDSTDGLD